MKSQQRIGVLVAGLCALAAVVALRGGDPELPSTSANDRRPEGAAAVAAREGGEVRRREVLPQGVGKAVDRAGLTAGTGTLCVHGSHVYDGIPAAGMNMRLESAPDTASEDPAGPFEARCDGLGVALFFSIPAGDYVVDNDRRDRAAKLTIHAGRTTTVHYEVARGARVLGRVVDGSGEPIAGASIQFVDTRRGGARHVIDTTGPDGTFRAIDLPVDLQLMAHAPGYCAVRGIELAKIKPGSDVEFVMEPGASIVEGFVTAPGGLPIVGAEVTIMKIDRDDPNVRVRTDDAGRFQATAVRPGKHDWHAVASGYEPNKGTCTAKTGMPTALHIALTPLPPNGHLMFPRSDWNSPSSWRRSIR